MGGLIFALLLGIVVAVLLVVTQHMSGRAKAWIFLGLPALCLVDSVLGHAALDPLCDRATRIQVYHQVRDVPGVGGPFYLSERSSHTYGYSYAEDRRRRVRREGGRVIYEFDIEPKAPYALSIEETSLTPWFTQRTYFTHPTGSKERLGEFSWIMFRGGWLGRLTRIFSDGGPSRFVAQCTPPGNESRLEQELLHATLVPAPQP